MKTMTVTLEVTVEEKEEDGALPTPELLVGIIGERMHDITKHDYETHWMVVNTQLVAE